MRNLRHRPLLSPAFHNRRMALEHFYNLPSVENGIYELSRGVIKVSDIEGLRHGRCQSAIGEQLIMWKLENSHRGSIAFRGECKVAIEPFQSERKPDICVYLRTAPHLADAWSYWVPEIIVEIVSPQSTHRDYVLVPEEYRRFGALEYWIVDPLKKRMTVNTRWRGMWKPNVIKASQKYTTPLLPGFSLDLKKVFAAAK